MQELETVLKMSTINAPGFILLRRKFPRLKSPDLCKPLSASEPQEPSSQYSKIPQEIHIQSKFNVSSLCFTSLVRAQVRFPESSRWYA